MAELALQMAATGLGASSQAQGEEFKMNQAARAAQYGQVQAAQTDSIMRQNLATKLANIQAVRASANTSAASPTGSAILARQEELSDTERSQRIANIMNQVQSDKQASAFYRSSAGNALLGGDLAMGGEFLSSVSKAAMMGAGGGG